MTKVVFAGLFLASMLVEGEEFPRACKAVEQLVQTQGCRLTECRLGGLSTVLLGSEDGPRSEVRGDLLLLDHECDPKSTIPNLFSSQRRLLQEAGFVLEGSAVVQDNFGSLVFRKEGHWLELTALVLEGAPSVSLRSVRTDAKAPRPHVMESVPTASSSYQQPSAIATAAAVVMAKPEPQAAIEAAGSETLPRVTARSEAVLPADVKLESSMADVEVEVVIDEKGSIARILSTKGNPALLSSALQSIRSWTFEPALLAGKSVASVLRLYVQFQARR